MRQHLERAAKQGHPRAIAELAERPLAGHLRPLWDAYLSFSRWRGAGAMGMNPMAATELCAFSAIYGVTFTPWQADVLKVLDVTHISIQMEAT